MFRKLLRGAYIILYLIIQSREIEFNIKQENLDLTIKKLEETVHKIEVCSEHDIEAEKQNG